MGELNIGHGEGFSMGGPDQPATHRDNGCCGKPKGCTNQSSGCMHQKHPYKRWVRGEISRVEMDRELAA